MGARVAALPLRHRRGLGRVLGGLLVALVTAGALVLWLDRRDGDSSASTPDAVGAAAGLPARMIKAVSGGAGRR